MIYGVLFTIILLILFLAWLRQPKKRVLVSPIRMDNGLVLEQRFSQKSRWQVFWDDNKAAICFAVGLAIGLTVSFS